jgi:hypothetical protein
MNDKYLGTCDRATRAFELDVFCCNSCHVDDEEYGYWMCYIKTPEGYYEVCCTVQAAFIEKAELK